MEETNKSSDPDLSNAGEVQVPNGYYLTPEYGSIERFISYFYQLEVIRDVNPASVLFVGVGDDLISGLLRKSIQVTTLDIDESLKPDVVGDVRKLPFENETYDLIVAFQVLEHLPFEEFEGILKEMHRVSKRDVIISVPHRRTGLELVLKFPFMRSLVGRKFLRLALLIPIPFQGFESSGQHYWEIDWWTTKIGKVRNVFRKYFVITKEITPVLDQCHRFFVLKKK